MKLNVKKNVYSLSTQCVLALQRSFWLFGSFGAWMTLPFVVLYCSHCLSRFHCIPRSLSIFIALSTILCIVVVPKTVSLTLVLRDGPFHYQWSVFVVHEISFFHYIISLILIEVSINRTILRILLRTNLKMLIDEDRKRDCN